MSTLILDIETVGEAWDELDLDTQETLLRWVDRTAQSEAERTAGKRDVSEGLGFSPLTGKIVAIGLYDLEREQGVVYYYGDGAIADYEYAGFALKSRTEKEMLEDFWDGAQAYDTFVTFNGRGFDVPFMNIRSAICGIRPTQQLLEGRYLYQQKTVRHVDLLDQLTFYGATHRKPSLHLVCRAFGIPSPKIDGIKGDNVAELFHAGKYRDIAEYNTRDVIATTELYKKWVTYLAPRSFTELPTNL